MKTLEGVTYTVKCSERLARRIWPDAERVEDGIPESPLWVRFEYGIAGFGLGFVAAVILGAAVL